jgi:hypothetical protein
MRKFRSYCYCGLIWGLALFALGPVQMNPRSNTENASSSQAHAPVKLIVGPGDLPIRGPHNEYTSNNWSGYVLTSGGYTSASFSWTVPAVTFVSYPSNPSFESSSSWVGIGGWGTSDLIQLGTEQYVTSTGSTIYRPWYEILPASETILPSQYTVSPGDSMSASLRCLSNCTANNSSTTWLLSMTDSTKQWTYTINLTYKSSLSSVEWIQEAPTYGSIVALPNYHSVDFTDAIVNGVNPNLSLSADGVILNDAAGGISTPCAAVGGNQFFVDYGTTCTTPSPPTVTSIAPVSGPGGGGTTVTITGTNFTGATMVAFGGTAATTFTVNSATSIAAISPAGSGTVDVTVTTPAGTSATGAADQFTYARASTVHFTQQGPLLVGAGAVGGANFGNSVALSADGNTALVGGPADNGFAGATWVFTRSGGVWSQQGPKLVGTGAVGNAQQGWSVSLSADGNTALIGGNLDNNNAGATWVFTRSGGVWSQQGSKLVGSGAVGKALQGTSVSLSADGNTALIGGSLDNSDVGATWVFTQSGGVWSQRGPKLVASGATYQGQSVALSGDGMTALVGSIGAVWVFTWNGSSWTQQAELEGTGAQAQQGSSTALSADGNTAFEGGNYRSTTGAGWVFTRSGSTWSQQGGSLVGTGYVLGPIGLVYEGYSVALSGDGNTALMGGPGDDSFGATWVFARSGGVWSQQGSKLVGTETCCDGYQGWSVALSSDGYTAIVGAPNGSGAVWVFTTPTASLTDTHDFNGDGYSDIAWRNSNGDVAIWLMDGTQVLSAPDVGNVPTSWSIVGQRQLNNSGYADLIWRNTDGDVAIWLMNGSQILSAPDLANVPTSWSIVGTGPYNASNGYAELFWRNSNGDVAVWEINGTQILSAPDLGNVPTSWTIAGTGDFAGTGNTDILWRNANGDVAIWLMNGTQVVSAPDVGNVPTSWTIVGTGDFNGDGKTDILWRNANGDVAIWLMNGTQLLSAPDVGNVPASWTIAETGDFNGDGYSDILWRNSNGDVAIWLMNGTQILSAPDLGNVPTSWTIQGANAD